MSDLQLWRERFEAARAARPRREGERELWGVHGKVLLPLIERGDAIACENSGGRGAPERRLLELYRRRVDSEARGLLWFWSADDGFDTERFIALATNAVPWYDTSDQPRLERVVLRLLVPRDLGVAIGYGAWLTVLMPLEDEQPPEVEALDALLSGPVLESTFGEHAVVAHRITDVRHQDIWPYDSSFPRASGYGFREWGGVLSVDGMPSVSPVETTRGWAVEIEGIDDVDD